MKKHTSEKVGHNSGPTHKNYSCGSSEELIERHIIYIYMCVYTLYDYIYIYIYVSI